MIYIVLGIFISFWTVAAVVYACCDDISKMEAFKATLAAYIALAFIVLSACLIIKGITSL